ncbi:hypothetical protein IscW_ISCW014237 [Ixodes scapularis]|uniref:Ionotropic glutamate receptor C-terminal domain-containing protein n=1 Tax=Ixodes scapularis TaxID=6945 RepID=B7QHW4_IXOSC|nr:hypothetical protein IscW_ISCW014237 [Ixodes scapularis]|eukprot:XP_002414771.1 hypothetical protein IscW_ISCW014237 [Ixodes scapularis]
MVGLITVTGCGRAAFLGARAKQMHLPHLALVRQNCEHLETGLPGDFFGDRDSMIASYVEARDVDVVISKTEDEGFTDILVLYDEKFALYGMELLMRRVQQSNVTFSYLRLSPDRKLVKRGIETVFRSQAERNSLYSGFGVLVFSNYTLAEQLEADNNMDPNIILLVFYNGWDLGLNSWYYTRVTSYPYEKLIHVILRSFPRNVRNRMKRVSYALDGKYHVVWLTILISLPTMSVVLWVIARTSPAHAQLDPDTRPAGLVKFFNCVWYLYGALLQQGGVHLPAASSARIILGFWWLYVLVVMAYYSSNLIAFLTVPEIHWIVSSFKNAVDREDLYIYVPYGTGLHQEIDTCEITLPAKELLMILAVFYLSHSTTRSTQHPCIRDYSTHAHGTSRPIGVRELEGVFLLLLFGTAISLITVPVELMVGLGRQRDKVQEIFQPASKKERKTPATIDLHRGWKQTQLKDSWTTVGPGGRFMTDRYPDFGRFGRRPIYVKEVPPFPHYRVNWRDAGDSRKLHGHVVVIGNRP